MVVYPNDETKFSLCGKLIVLEEYIIEEFSEIGAQTRAYWLLSGEIQHVYVIVDK